MSVLQGLIQSIVGASGGTAPVTNSSYFGQQWLYVGTASSPTIAPTGSYNLVASSATSDFVTFADGSTGYVSGFDGTKSYTTANLNAASLMTDTTDIAIDLWIYPTVHGVQVLNEWGQTSLLGWHATVIEINTNDTVSGRLWDGGTLTSTDTVTLNAWNHIYLCYSNSTLTLRVNNGTAVTLSTYSRTSNYFAGGPVYWNVGVYDNATNLGNSSGFQGQLGELRINNWAAPSNYWSGAKKYLNLGGNIVVDANLKFDLQGIVAPNGSHWDSTNNSRFAQLQNTITHNPGIGYYTFNGQNYAYINGEGNNLGTINTTPAQTMTMWVRVTQADQYQTIAGFRPEGNYNFYLLLLSPVHGSPTYETEYRVTTSSTQIDTKASYINFFGKWTHITCIADGTQTRIYFNSKLAMTGNISGNFGNNTADFDLCSPNWVSAGTDFAEIQFYDRVLTQAEIERNYATNKFRLSL